MCNERNKVRIKLGKKYRYVDACLAPKIAIINADPSVETLASCCGHGRYKTTIFVRAKWRNGVNDIYEFFSEIDYQPEKRRCLNFYKKDKDGYYFNPKIEGKDL